MLNEIFMTDRKGDGSGKVTVDITSGIRIVSVVTEDGVASNYKLIVR